MIVESVPMRLTFVLCLLLALVPVARADLIIPQPPTEQVVAPETAAERWLPTALVGLGIGAAVLLCVTIARRGPAKK